MSYEVMISLYTLCTRFVVCILLDVNTYYLTYIFFTTV